MRLTLGTLLAYLNDMLEPSQARELGAKIQESEAASELVMKIRDVIRKRRLTAPVVSGPGCDLDANLVAEYLDNTLAPEGVIDVERICLESDVHLAEVAATLQILTLALGERPDFTQASRERMYALGEAARTAGSTVKAPATGAAAAPVTSAGPAVVAKPAAVAAAPIAATGQNPAVKPVAGSRPLAAASPVLAATLPEPAERHAEVPFDRTIPDYLKAPPLWKRSLPLVIALLLVVWVGMLFSDKEMLMSILGSRPNPAPEQVAQVGEKAAAPATTAAPAVAPQNPADQPRPETLVTENAAEGPEMAEPEPAGDAVAAVPNPAVDPPPPADAEEVPAVKAAPEPGPTVPATAPTAAPTAAPKVVKAPAGAVARADTNAVKKGAKPATEPLKPATPQAVPAARSNPAQYVSADSVVLRYDGDRPPGFWFRLPPRAHVFADDALAVPEPFDANFHLGREKHRLTVLGPAVVGIVDPMKDLPMGINLLRGRVILQPAEVNEGAAAAAAPLNMLLSVQGSTWRLELTEPATKCGIEAVPREPHQLEEDFGTHGWTGKLYVWKGTVKVTNAEGQTHTVTGPDSLVLAADTSHHDVDAATRDLPNWERRLSTLAQKNARAFADEFKAEDTSAHDALLGLVDSRIYAQSRLAVACLGLVGDYEMMLEVLDRNEHHESRVAAITALRSWVNQDPQNRVKLKEAIAAKFYPQEVDVVYRLIWGYQEQDARSKQTSEQLVDWLEHDRLAVRELAWFYVKSLTNRKLEMFDARGTPMHISAAVQKIRKILEKDGTLLSPVPNKAASLGTDRRLFGG